jgi:two-component sensor histidine kinase
VSIHGPSDGKRKRSYPAALHLIVYGFAIALPLVLMLGTLLLETASSEREQSRQQLVRALSTLTDTLDRDIDRRVTILETLATSEAVKQRNWPALYEQAKSALQGRAYVILVDASGRQLVNTYVPYGQEPLTTGDPQTIRRIAESKRPVVSNLFTSLVVKRPVINISIPVFEAGEFRYVLSLGLLPEDLALLLREQNLPANWIALIWDADNIILARSRANEQFVGQAIPAQMRPRAGDPTVVRTTNLDGEDVLYATSHSRLSDWGVGIHVPVQFLERSSHITFWLTAAALGAIILAVGLGIVFARELMQPLVSASNAALALGRGDTINITPSRLSEANTFNEALHSAQKELEQRRNDEQILIRELQHRTNNLLTVIQSIAHSTFSDAASLKDARTTFEGRLQALARVNRELTSSNWSSVNLDDIVRFTMEPYAARININGIPVKLNAKHAQNMTLAVHELATNALKYGALSNSSGTINVSWRPSSLSTDLIDFRWQEKDGPSVAAPTRKGFGTSLLRAAFSDIKLDYSPTGLICEFQVTTADAGASPSPPT